MSDNNEKVTLENKFENLEKIINQMEANDVTLDASFELYKSGVQELKEANELLDNIEKAMLVINNAGDMKEFECSLNRSLLRE